MRGFFVSIRQTPSLTLSQEPRFASHVPFEQARPNRDYDRAFQNRPRPRPRLDSPQDYWAGQIPRSVFRPSRAGLAVLRGHRSKRHGRLLQVVSDRATFAYLSDMFVDPACRGQGIGKALMERIMAHPDLQSLRRYSRHCRCPGPLPLVTVLKRSLPLSASWSATIRRFMSEWRAPCLESPHEHIHPANLPTARRACRMFSQTKARGREGKR